ncbi:MAG TPA: tyrosine-type recombinase/integrase [Bryobacteraceae bacterium]|nr:tyrosine-type recombinase/integrase [Bryobacteraceae bacterium]
MLPVPVTTAAPFLSTIIREMVLNSVRSEHSKRAYGEALDCFLEWYTLEPRLGFLRATVNGWRAALETSGLAASTINVRLAAVRKLAEEASAAGFLDQATAASIAATRSCPSRGVRTGNWLTRAQAEKLLSAPDGATMKGLRDRALLTVLLGCGLRRSEAAALSLEHVQQREGRWVIVDLKGKGGRVRSVPMPSWCKAAIDAWTAAAGMSAGTMFRPVNRGGRIAGKRITPDAIHKTLQKYAAQLGLAIAPHDLRRSFAKLAHRGNAPIEQIQLSLGHASIQTTERYLGVRQDLADAPCDHLGMRIGWKNHIYP